MGKSRKRIKAMFDAVERGTAFTIRASGEPVAMVLPWDMWLAMNRELCRQQGTSFDDFLAEALDEPHRRHYRKIEERLLPPSARRLSDPMARLSQDLNAPKLKDNPMAHETARRYDAMMGGAGGTGGDGGSGGPGAGANGPSGPPEPRCEHCGVVGGGHARDCIGAGAHDYSEGPPL